MAGCKADVITPQKPNSLQNQSETAGMPDMFSQKATSPTNFGIYFNADSFKLWAGQALDVSYQRNAVTLSQYGGFDKVFLDMTKANFSLLTNFNYYPTSKKTPFVTDLTGYKSKLDEYLTLYQPQVAVIENEEENQSYHTGPAQNYINELSAAVQIAHNHNVQVTNGGLNAQTVIDNLYRDYLKRGYPDSAATLASRAILTGRIRALKTYGISPDLDATLAFDSTLLAAYTKLKIDYVNIHFYEPILYRCTDTPQNIIDTVDHATQDVLVEVSNYLTRITGKPVICNEMGQINSSQTLVTGMLKNAIAANLKYVIWNDSQKTNDVGTVGLTVGQTVMPNGIAFKNFVRKN